jgi:predicted dehydrogenase
LLTGFNRRFSKYAQAIQKVVKDRTHPMILNYRMNAGYLPPDHWTQGEEGGGRNLGEACHIYDLFTFLTGSRAVKVEAQSIKPSGGYYGSNDNFVAVISFEDGSVGTLTYTALGSREHPKEQMEVYFDGKVVTLVDYKRLEGAGIRVPALAGKVPDKGQKEELEAFAQAIQKGGEWPIPLWQQVQAMEIAFRVEKILGQSREAL